MISIINNKLRTREELKQSCIRFNDNGLFLKERHFNNSYICNISNIKSRRPYTFINNKMVPYHKIYGVRGNPKNKMICEPKLATIFEDYEEYFTVDIIV